MNSLVDPEVICGPLSDTASRIGCSGVTVEQPLGLQRASEQDLHLDRRRFRAQQHIQPLAADEVQQRERLCPRRGERGQVIAPDRVGLVLDPFGPRLAHVGHGRWPGREEQVVSGQNAPHGGRRDPHQLLVGAAVRKLAMGAIDLTPRPVQREDRVQLAGAQPVHRMAAAGLVVKLAGVTASPPAPGSTLL
jgi:hypothetical protein